MIVLGWRSHTSQEVATNLLLLVGFSIEWIVLQKLVLNQATLDSSSDLGQMMPLLVIGSSIVILCLLFHQFAIFRNFSVPWEVEQRERLDTIDAAVQKSLDTLNQGDATKAIDLLQNVPSAREIAPPTDLFRRRVQKGFEILIFALFGVLTGEAGYMLTVLHEHDQSHWTSQAIRNLFGTTGWEWGRTLECAFLLCAALVCLFVLIWDFVIAASPKARERYRGSLPTFIKNDFLSLLFWSCLFIVNTPSIRFLLGERFAPRSEIGPILTYAWGILILFSVLYVLVVLKRIWRALGVLAAEPTYMDARVRQV